MNYVCHVRRGHLMFTTNDSGFEVGGRRPACLSGEEAEATRLAAWRTAWDNRVRCCGMTRSGEQCKNVPTKGKLFCMRHGGGRKPPGGRKAGRHPLTKPPTALAEHAREMRRLWRADPWTDGYTVELDPEGQDRLESWSAGVGISWAWLSPRVQDFARWAYVNSCRSGRHPDDDARASDTLAERIRAQDRKDGIESAGSHVDRTGASRHFARYRAVPPLDEAAPGWRDSPRGKPRRIVHAAAMQLARDRALAASEPQNRKEAVARLLAMERLAARSEGESSSKRRPTPDAARSGRDGW